MKYDPKQIEKKWQKFWEENKTFAAVEDSSKEKFYGLIEFPYPSGAGLHVGHPRSYTAMDVICRKRRMQGFNVLYPIGFDSFGLPTENFAIKTGRPPEEITAENIATFTKQLKSLGLSFDWDRAVTTSDPKYYRWTQWIFLQLFKHGLAYKKNQPINWCPKDKIGLANEEVVDGCCERCGSPVEKRNKEQWMLAITKYADKLLEGLNEVDYISRAKIQQENWIGRSEGALIKFAVKSQVRQNEESPDITRHSERSEESPGSKGSFANAQDDDFVEVFTTRPDTIFGATFLAISAELAKKWLEVGWAPSEEVKKYVAEILQSRTTAVAREELEKTGVATNVIAINPANGEEIPVWIVNYVLGDVGTGAIMAVPAHDERDMSFAVKYNIGIRSVVRSEDDAWMVKLSDGYIVENKAFTDEGIAVNSGFLDGLKTAEAKEKIIFWLEEKGIGKRQVNYKLRDWVFSRQRYWGEPIPLVFCEQCKNKKYNFIFLHGFGGRSGMGFKPWLKLELEKFGHTVWNPDLPNTDAPDVNEQADFILENAPFAIDENTVLIGHSLGGPVVYRVLEKINKKIAKAILVDPVYKPEFPDTTRSAVEKSCDWKFDWKKISCAVGECVILGDSSGKTIKPEHLRELSLAINGRLLVVTPTNIHFSCNDDEITQEPEILKQCVSDGWIPLPENQLPLTLPKVEKYLPTDTGESPLAPLADWVNTTCPDCGGPARRETDTMPNWAGSSWYWLRYADPKNDQEFASPEKLNYWLGGAVIPTRVEGSKEGDSSTSLRSARNDNTGGVDWYNGGMEHTVLHLLYSRFWNQFLYDIGVVPMREPYKKRTSHGMILAKGGEKMSKSRGNVVNPDEMIAEFGADTLRTYISFMGPFDQAVEWDTNGLIGVRRFLDRVWNLQDKVTDDKIHDTRNKIHDTHDKIQKLGNNIKTILQQTIKKISDDIESMRFNTAIAKLMELSNEMTKEEKINAVDYRTFIKLLAPFAPHIAEELWAVSGQEGNLADAAWPEYDPELAKESEIIVVAQVNGKVRAEFTVSPEISEEEIKQLVLSSEKVKKWLEGREPKKVIYVKGKLVSIVV